MASSPRSSPIAPSAATAASRTSGSRPAPRRRPAPTSVASTSSAHDLVLAARPRRDLDDGRVGVGERGRRSTSGWRGGELARPAGARRRRGRRTPPQSWSSSSTPRRSRAPSAVARTPGRRAASPAAAVATSPVCPASGARLAAGRSLLEQVGERRDDPRQAERRDGGETAPITSASPELATTAHTRRSGPAGVVRRGDAPRRPRTGTRRGVSAGLRGRFGCALAVLRHPASTRATTRQAGDPGHPNGEIVDRHAGRDVNPGPAAGGGHRRARRRASTGCGRSRCRRSACSCCSPSPSPPLAAGQPRRRQGGRRPRRPDADRRARRRRTPGRPRSAQPVDDRVSFGAARGRRRGRRGPHGRHLLRDDLRAAAVGAVVVGRRRRQLRHGRRRAAPSRRSTSSPTRRSTAPQTPEPAPADLAADDAHVAQVAQYVALQALGYDDATILPGDVVVAELVCLEAGADGLRHATRRPTRCSTPATRCSRVDGVPLRHGRRPRRRSSPASEPGDTVRARDRAARRRARRRSRSS